MKHSTNRKPDHPTEKRRTRRIGRSATLQTTFPKSIYHAILSLAGRPAAQFSLRLLQDGDVLTLSQSQRGGRVELGVIDAQSSHQLGTTYTKLNAHRITASADGMRGTGSRLTDERKLNLNQKNEQSILELTDITALKDETLKVFASARKTIEESIDVDKRAEKEVERFRALRNSIEKRRGVHLGRSS